MSKIRDVINFLIENGVEDQLHTGRGLLSHLLGTAEFLMKWECSPDVVVAGLCHSIYGTESYRPITIDHSRRDEVRELIGDRAEMLSWEFGMRPLPRINSFIENGEIDLVVIECANLIEQCVEPSFLSAALVVDLPINVRNAVNAYLKKY